MENDDENEQSNPENYIFGGVLISISGGRELLISAIAVVRFHITDECNYQIHIIII